MTPAFLGERINARKERGLYRQLRPASRLIDFCSNDYLGLVFNNLLSVNESDVRFTGSTGSRLLTGNHSIFPETEARIAAFHDSEAALIFNSGYDANLGLLSCIATKADTIIYDALSHASIRDGVRLSHAESWSFQHNDINDLRLKLSRARGKIFVVTESVFSMDGDEAPLLEIATLCEHFGACLIVDEAHATGVKGAKGEGLCQELDMHKKCFARIYTYGKAFGCHGAAITGSKLLVEYLVNFCRTFIYSTAMPPASVAHISLAYRLMPSLSSERMQLAQLIRQFQQSNLVYNKLPSTSAIQAVVVPGNENARSLAAQLVTQGLDVRPILYPTVPEGSERLRIILHSFNTLEEVAKLTEALQRE